MDEGLLNGTVTTVLILWFLACVVAQLPGKPSQTIRHFDPLGFLPSWSFFAPRPAQSDFHILYRDFMRTGSVTEWREVIRPLWRPWYSFAWNPEKRQKKALFDAINVLLRDETKDHLRLLPLELPYLLLLQHISGRPHSVGAHATQFLIMNSSATGEIREPKALLISAVHEL
jgi:hypothetical protein